MQAENAAPLINKLREAGILARGADRARPAVSPEAVRPTGRFANLSDAVQHFLATRAETIRYVENCSEDLRSMLTTHPLFGPLNCQEILLLIVVHPVRHAKQIDEIRAALALAGERRPGRIVDPEEIQLGEPDYWTELAMLGSVDPLL